MGIVSLIFLLFSGPLTAIIAPGFGSEGREAVRILFVMMIPVIVLHAVLSVMKGFLNAREHFAAPEMSGILWNIIFILFALALSGKIGIYSLAAGVSTGSLVQVLLQIPFLRRHGIRYSFTLALGHPSVREARNLFAGALIATSIVPINSFVGRVIASYLPQGEVASLAYASRIFILPFSLFAVPTYTVLFSRISTLYHAKDRQGIRGHIDSSLILLCVTLVPATIFLCLAGDIFVKILYERGAFSAKDTAMTYRALFGYSVGLLFYALSISFVRIFNAFHDMKTPAIVGVTSILLNALLAYLLMHSLGNLGISLATSIVSFYNFMLLYFILKTKIGYRMARETRREIIRSLLAGIITALLIFSIRSLLGSASVLSFVLSLVAACSVYGILFKSYYLHYIGRKMGRRPGNSKE
jgi:putative peptidoglycan lipid II flippase